jgi:uncharacterized membrane protein
MGAIFEKMGALVDKIVIHRKHDRGNEKKQLALKDQLFESTLLVLIALVVTTLYVSGIDQYCSGQSSS